MYNWSMSGLFMCSNMCQGVGPNVAASRVRTAATIATTAFPQLKTVMEEMYVCILE